MDLKSLRSVTSITSWSFNKNNNRGAQSITLFGSNLDSDPGWDTSNRERFTPIGSIDTTCIPVGKFNAISLHARKGESPGTFHWIVWKVNPVTSLTENTVFQELAVESASAGNRK